MHLKAETTTLNAQHEALIDLFEESRSSVLRTFFKAFYNVGAFAGVVGVLIGLAILGLESWRIMAILWLDKSGPAYGARGAVGRRSYDEGMSYAPPLEVNPIVSDLYLMARVLPMYHRAHRFRE